MMNTNADFSCRGSQAVLQKIGVSRVNLNSNFSWEAIAKTCDRLLPAGSKAFTPAAPKTH